jgi:hypothetical protein
MTAWQLGAWSWLSVKDGDDRALGIYRRHYSHRAYKDGRKPRLFVGPGEKMVLLTQNCKALFVWRRFIDASGQTGVNCAVFRHEGSAGCKNSSHPHCSSNLISRAMELAWQRWPRERLYTYVNAKKIRSANPGYCFKRAGWKTCGETKGGLVILEALDQRPLTASAYPITDAKERPGDIPDTKKEQP